MYNKRTLNYFHEAVIASIHENEFKLILQVFIFIIKTLYKCCPCWLSEFDWLSKYKLQLYWELNTWMNSYDL